MSVWMNDKNS